MRVEFAVVPARGAKHARGVELMSEDGRYARSRISIVVRARGQREEGPVEIGCLPPGQKRARVEDLQSAHQEDDEADRVDPVADPHEGRMSDDDADSRRVASGQGGRNGRQRRVSNRRVKALINTFAVGPTFRA